MIVSCGEALVDMVPDPVPGGGPMNVAVAAARLGAPSAFVGRISTDEHGEDIWRYLRANGVDLGACERGPEPTARAIVEHVPHVVFRFEGADTADTKLSAADLTKLGDGPHILHGGTLGLFRGRTAETLARMVEQQNGIVSLDPNVRPQIIDNRDQWDHYHHRWIARTQIYKASDEDIAWIWPGRTADSCAEELLDDGIGVVFATHGSGGVTVFTQGEAIVVPARPVAVVDTIGAGDTFVAAALVSLWERGVGATLGVLGDIGERGWRAIAERAVAASAVTCSRPGADPPFLDELTPSTAQEQKDGSS